MLLRIFDDAELFERRFALRGSEPKLHGVQRRYEVEAPAGQRKRGRGDARLAESVGDQRARILGDSRVELCARPHPDEEDCVGFELRW